ncbi:hypothetical protein JB92DRAFT_3153319 [Gautieria morchelliformis]|nr:hypothetical protein JB92DRAFT_3153319 [Gautieria morchelliformis]
MSLVYAGSAGSTASVASVGGARVRGSAGRPGGTGSAGGASGASGCGREGLKQDGLWSYKRPGHSKNIWDSPDIGAAKDGNAASLSNVSGHSMSYSSSAEAVAFDEILDSGTDNFCHFLDQVVLRQFLGQGDSAKFHDPHCWCPDGKASGPHAHIHEDSQAHRCNVQYRKASASTVLQNNATASGNSEGDATVRPSVQEDELPESGRDGWEDNLSGNATDGLEIGPVHAGPSWISSSSKTVLDPSLCDNTVFELARALDQYLALHVVPAGQASDGGDLS